MPVGATKGNRVKVRDGDTGKVSWRSGKKGFVKDNQGGEPIAKIPRLSDFITSHKVPSARAAPKAKDGTKEDNSDSDGE